MLYKGTHVDYAPGLVPAAGEFVRLRRGRVGGRVDDLPAGRAAVLNLLAVAAAAQPLPDATIVMGGRRIGGTKTILVKKKGVFIFLV